ncbi:MAG: hypothetical protein JW888_11840 [Pirellulales bacterium]|nr:hypothetical protein [Pirellulales bacterium]
MEVHLLGRVDFDRVAALQDRLVDEVAARDDGQMRLLFCEHPPLITIGRAGTPAEIHYEVDLVRDRRIGMRWVKRGGGCVVHSPGQLAVYPIVPLGWFSTTPGEFLNRLQAAVRAALDELGFPTETRAGQFGLWGRTGQLAVFGVAVRRWVTYHGVYVNVCPTPGLAGLVESDRDASTRMGSLAAERRGRAKMPRVRAALIRHLSDRLGADRYHMHTGHPLLGERG